MQQRIKNVHFHLPKKAVNASKNHIPSKTPYMLPSPTQLYGRSHYAEWTKGLLLKQHLSRIDATQTWSQTWAYSHMQNCADHNPTLLSVQQWRADREKYSCVLGKGFSLSTGPVAVWAFAALCTAEASYCVKVSAISLLQSLIDSISRPYRHWRQQRWCLKIRVSILVQESGSMDQCLFIKGKEAFFLLLVGPLHHRGFSST